MKQLLLVFILSLVSVSSNAKEVIRYEDSLEVCQNVADLSRTIMQARVAGLSYSEAKMIALSSNDNERAMTNEIVEYAYGAEKYQYLGFSPMFVIDIGKDFYLACMEEMGY